MSDFADGEPQLEAGEISARLAQQLAAALARAGHDACEYAPEVVYVPDGPDGEPVALCGCGVLATFAAPGSTVELADGARRGGTAVYTAADPIASTLALIDPTQMYTPDDVEHHILDVLYRLETGALFEREAIEAAYRTAQELNLAYETVIHQSQASSQDKRKAEATVKTADLARAASEAKMTKEAIKQTMHNLRSILTGYQSVGRSIQSTYQAGGSQGAPPRQGSYRP